MLALPSFERVCAGWRGGFSGILSCPRIGTEPSFFRRDAHEHAPDARYVLHDFLFHGDPAPGEENESAKGVNGGHEARRLRRHIRWSVR